MPGPGFYPWRSEAVLVHARLGRADEALRLAEEEAELARARAVPEMQGVALRALGLVTGGPRGCDLLDAAVGILKQSPARFRYAQALVDGGSSESTAAASPKAAPTCRRQPASPTHAEPTASRRRRSANCGRSATGRVPAPSREWRRSPRPSGGSPRSRWRA